MGRDLSCKYLVGVVGAGPAGLFAAKQLATEGAYVVLINRDIRPGGLAEYGIYPDKLKMKDGLRAQFRQILALPQVDYYGNITIGQQADLSLADLKKAGFQALLVTVGAQGTKWQGLPGEDLRGVYHAKDLVYHYNLLPPFSQQTFDIGRRVAVVGAGNVMLDITHFLISRKKVDQVVSLARRGPGEAKYDHKELETVIANLDLAAMEAEIERATPLMKSLGEDPDRPRELLKTAQAKAAPSDNPATHFTIQFMKSVTRILGDESGRVSGLEVEENTLVLVDGQVKARGTGKRSIIPVDTVIFAIGDRVDETFGLPSDGNEFIKNPAPRYPQEELSYEVFNPQTGQPVAGLFVAGWSRKSSTGLVGMARRDGTNGAKAVLQYLQQTQPPLEQIDLAPWKAQLARLNKPVITCAELDYLFSVERQQGAAMGVEGFKFGSNEEMLEAIRSAAETIR